MTIEIIKLDNGEEFKIDTQSPEFKAYERAAEFVGLTRKDESFFFARNLEFIRQRIFRPVYAELKMLNGGLITIDTSIPEGAETDTYDILDSSGEADIISDYGDDIKTVEISGEQVTNKIKSLADSYFYSIQDMRRDKMLGQVGRSSVENKALAARKAVDQKIDKMIRVGAVEHGILGMFNATGVPSTAAAATGSGSATTWASKTAANILADVETAINDIDDLTDGNEVPDTLLLPSAQYELIRKKALDTTFYSGKSVLKYIQEEYGLKVEKVQQLKNAFTGGTESGMVLYKNSPEKLEAVLPIRLMPHAPQVKNLATKNILEARCGGVRVYFPYSMSYTTGI